MKLASKKIVFFLYQVEYLISLNYSIFYNLNTQEFHLITSFGIGCENLGVRLFWSIPYSLGFLVFSTYHNLLLKFYSNLVLSCLYLSLSKFRHWFRKQGIILTTVQFSTCSQYFFMIRNFFKKYTASKVVNMWVKLWFVSCFLWFLPLLIMCSSI